MIPKGNQRGGGQLLATHLLNEFDNDRIEVAEVSGAIAQDLHGAFAEWRAVSDSTRCTKYLYALSINPWEDLSGRLDRAQYFDFIERTEQALGLEGQPRAVVFHEKKERQHAHVVWSRIYFDDHKDKLLAKQISHDRQKLRMLVREFARDHGLELPENAKTDRGLERHFENAIKPALRGKQQEERSGITKEQHMQKITALWEARDTPQSFFQALESSGYYLCRGDRRGYSVAHRYGEVYSLPRMIHLRDVKTKQVREFLSSAYPLEKLASVEEAHEYIGKHPDTDKPRTKEDFSVTSSRLHAELKKMHAARREQQAGRVTAMVQRHEKELAALKAIHEQKDRQLRLDRLAKEPAGIRATLYRITGLTAVKKFVREKLDQRREDRQRLEETDLARRHHYELADLGRNDRSLTKVENYERRSLERRLRREQRERREQERQGETERGTVQPRPAPKAEPDWKTEMRKSKDRARKRDRDKGRDR